ncbi:MAG: site-2 protease family protein [Ruminococcus sp.]|nr:site-2 protease family protein [Ruminococcus sp.]
MLFSLFRGQLDFQTAVAQILAILVIVFLVLPFHEWAHALTASKLGDTSIKYRGRLTLNPIAHVDPIGALALLLFGFGWAKPVPVDPRNFKKPKAGMALVALMGPVANLVAALVGLLIFNLLSVTTGNFMMTNTFGIVVYTFLSFYVTINIRLAVFNLLPIPPLDGSKILFLFLPDRWVAKFYQYQQIISIALIALLWAGVLSVPLDFLSGLLGKGLSWLAWLPFSPFV